MINYSQFDYNSVIFTDEVEIMANPKNGIDLGIHFNGIYFDLEKASYIKHDLDPIVSAFGKKGFHSKNIFKQKDESSFALMSYMTEIIIRNHIIWINFPFSKKTMNSPGLKPFFDMKFTEMEFQKTNYRAVAFFLYFHSIHYYQEKFKIFNPKIRIYTDKDEYLKCGSEFHHHGKILFHLERIISTKGKNEPFLYLADFLSFMFGRVKSNMRGELYDYPNVLMDNIDPLTKICFFNTIRLVQNDLFKVFNFWELLPTE